MLVLRVGKPRGGRRRRISCWRPAGAAASQRHDADGRDAALSVPQQPVPSLAARVAAARSSKPRCALRTPRLSRAVAFAFPKARRRAGRHGPRLLRTDNSNQSQVRPRSIVVGMASIDRIHWARWSTTANGRGVARVPSAGGGVRPHAATIRAWRARRGVYTRLRWAYGSGAGRYSEYDVLLQGSGAHFWRVCAFPGYRSNSPVCR